MAGIAEGLFGKKKITEKNIEETLRDMKVALLDADVNLRVANTIIDNVKNRAVGMKVITGVSPGQQFVKLLYDELVLIMGSEKQSLVHRDDGKPTVVMLAGLQGAGKTTSAAKLASYLMTGEKPRSVMLVAADVYRPAAIEQLQTLGERLGIPVYAEDPSNKPVEIAKRAVKEAAARRIDTVLIDTAGRQVIDEVLMQELRDIKKAVSADELLLVVDAMTGQEAATLTAKFNDDVGISGAILTKLDGDTRGGSALSVRGVSGRPIKFIGTGETMEKLEPFYPERMASRIMGMGDIVTFVEKAQKEMDEGDVNAMAERMAKGQFTFDDYLSQTKMIKNMGSMSGVLKMIPGMAGKVSQEQVWTIEKKLKVAQSIIEQMTPEERTDPDILISGDDAKIRVRRLGDSSGQGLEKVKELLAEFEQMRAMMQSMAKKLPGSTDAGAETVTGSKAQSRAAAKNQRLTRGGGKGFGG